MDSLADMLQNLEFTVVFRGYDQDEVNAYLEKLGRAAAQLQGRVRELHDRAEAAETRLAGIADPGTDDGDSVQSLLMLAQQTGEAYVTEARTSADALLQEAETQALEARTAAETRSLELMTDAEQRSTSMVEDAESRSTTMLTDAEETATRLVSDAEAKAESLVSEAAAERADLVANARDDAAKAADAERTRLLADIERLEALRAQLDLDVSALDGHLRNQRASLEASSAVLAAMIENPAMLQTAPPPEVSDVSLAPEDVTVIDRAPSDDEVTQELAALDAQLWSPDRADETDDPAGGTDDNAALAVEVPDGDIVDPAMLAEVDADADGDEHEAEAEVRLEDDAAVGDALENALAVEEALADDDAVEVPDIEIDDLDTPEVADDDSALVEPEAVAVDESGDEVELVDSLDDETESGAPTGEPEPISVDESAPAVEASIELDDDGEEFDALDEINDDMDDDVVDADVVAVEAVDEPSTSTEDGGDVFDAAFAEFDDSAPGRETFVTAEDLVGETESEPERPMPAVSFGAIADDSVAEEASLESTLFAPPESGDVEPDPFLEQLREAVSEPAEGDEDDDALSAFFEQDEDERKSWFGRRR